MNQRFKWIGDWGQPEMFWHRLFEPDRRKKPAKIFVGSMCDLFGDWIKPSWIQCTIKMCEDNSRHTFMFLTKNPARYTEFDFPENCWLGATVTEPSNDKIGSLYRLINKSFISIEPLLGDFTGHDFTDVDLIIVGAMTGPGAVVPKKEWIESIKHPNIHYKNNIKKWLK